MKQVHLFALKQENKFTKSDNKLVRADVLKLSH